MKTRKIVVEVPEVVYLVLERQADEAGIDISDVVQTEIAGLINDLYGYEVTKILTRARARITKSYRTIDTWLKEYPPR